MVERLWAGWRVPEMVSARAGGGEGSADGSEGSQPDRTLFEGILASGRPDSETHLVWRGEKVFALLNRFPYTNGHLLVAPYRPVADLEGLDLAERRELWDAVHDAALAIKAAFQPDGLNVGLNLGDGAGPSVPDHLHVHVLPRWRGDTNFTTALADVRVLPMTLADAWERLRAAWPK